MSKEVCTKWALSITGEYADADMLDDVRIPGLQVRVPKDEIYDDETLNVLNETDLQVFQEFQRLPPAIREHGWHVIKFYVVSEQTGEEKWISLKERHDEFNANYLRYHAYA